MRIDPSALGAHLKSRKSLKKKKNDGVDGLEGGRERACCLVRGRHRSGDQQPEHLRQHELHLVLEIPGHRWIGDGLIAQHDRIAGLN